MAIYYGEHELSFNNHEEMLKLPVNPEVVEISQSGFSKIWHTTEVGDFKAIGHPELIRLKLSSFFPAKHYPFCTYDSFPSPEECVALIKKWLNSKRPIRYINTDVINDAFSIEDFTYSKEMGTGDIYYELILEQYRFSEYTNRQNGSIEVDNESLMIIITLEKGQTLCQLAEEWLGDSDKYKDIAELNGIKDVGHPWDATEKNFHQLEIVCPKGTVGYDKIKGMKGVG